MWYSSLRRCQSCKQKESRKAKITWLSPSCISTVASMVLYQSKHQWQYFTKSRALQPPDQLPWEHDSAESAADHSTFEECCSPQNPLGCLPHSENKINFNAIFINNLFIQVCNYISHNLIDLTHLSKLLQPLQWLTIVLGVLTIVYLNVLGQKRRKEYRYIFLPMQSNAIDTNVTVIHSIKQSQSGKILLLA